MVSSFYGPRISSWFESTPLLPIVGYPTAPPSDSFFSVKDIFSCGQLPSLMRQTQITRQVFLLHFRPSPYICRYPNHCRCISHHISKKKRYPNHILVGFSIINHPAIVYPHDALETPKSHPKKHINGLVSYPNQYPPTHPVLPSQFGAGTCELVRVQGLGGNPLEKSVGVKFWLSKSITWRNL